MFGQENVHSVGLIFVLVYILIVYYAVKNDVLMYIITVLNFNCMSVMHNSLYLKPARF